MSRKNWYLDYFGLAYVLGDNRKDFVFDTLKERVKVDVDYMIKFGEIKEGYKILDIPCGYGKHSIELCRRLKCKVVGVDINPVLIGIAKYREKHQLDIDENKITLKAKPEFIIGDMRNLTNFVSQNYFDIVINWFWSFGYFSDKENKKVLSEFYKVLKPKGILLIQTIVQENIKNYVGGEKVKEIFSTKIMGNMYPQGYLHFQKIYDSKRKTLQTLWFIKLENGKKVPKKPPKSTVRIYSTDEYKKMLENIGFKKVEIFNSYFPIKIIKVRK